EARDRDAGLVRGLDDHRALGHGQLHLIDEDGDLVRRQVRINRLGAHAATPWQKAGTPLESKGWTRTRAARACPGSWKDAALMRVPPRRNGPPCRRVRRRPGSAR